MNQPRLLRYVMTYWPAFVSSVVLSVAAGLVVPLGRLGAAISAIISLDQEIVVASTLVLAVGLLLSWQRQARFWRRYRRTQNLARPPLLYIDLISIGVLAFLITLATRLSDNSFALPPRLLLLAPTLVLLWLLSAWAWSLTTPRPRPRAGIEARPARPGDYPDDPITTEEADLLGRQHFVAGFYEQIHALPFSNSFVFGLHGRWGEGKTSALNLLQLRIERDPTLIPVSFNPWYLPDQAALIHQFYARLEEALAERYLLSGLHRLLRRYRAALTLGLQYFGIGRDLSVQDDPQKLRAELEEWIARTGQRLVVLIDDIDRLQAPELLTVFKLVRLATRLENIIFVLSFDVVAVDAILRNIKEIDPAFLEKIVQKPLRLPPAEQRDIDRFLLFSEPGETCVHRSAIDRLLDELALPNDRRAEFDREIVVFYSGHLRRLFKTLRDAKRYMNSLRPALAPVVTEVNLYDFFLLEALHVFAPRLYDDIWRNQWSYLPAWSDALAVSTPFAFQRNEEEKYRLIREHIDRLLQDEPEATVLKEILTALFFIEVKNAFQDLGRTRHEDVAQSYEAAQRLTHPRCFPRYFLFRLPAGELPDAVIHELISHWNSSTSDEVSRSIEDALRDYKERGKLTTLFDRIIVFADSVESRVVPVFAGALARMSNELDRGGGNLWRSESDVAEVCLLRIINTRAEEGEIAAILDTVVREASSLHCVVSLVDRCDARRGGTQFRIYQNANLNLMRQTAGERLHKYFIERRRDIFTELPDVWPFVLYQWGTNWTTIEGANRQIVERYVLTLIDMQPGYLGRLLRAFVDRTGLPRGRAAFSLAQFQRVYDPSQIIERLNRVGSAAFADPHEEQAVALFREAYASRQAEDRRQGAAEERQ